MEKWSTLSYAWRGRKSDWSAFYRALAKWHLKRLTTIQFPNTDTSVCVQFIGGLPGSSRYYIFSILTVQNHCFYNRMNIRRPPLYILSEFRHWKSFNLIALKNLTPCRARVFFCTVIHMKPCILLPRVFFSRPQQCVFEYCCDNFLIYIATGYQALRFLCWYDDAVFYISTCSICFSMFNTNAQFIIGFRYKSAFSTSRRRHQNGINCPKMWYTLHGNVHILVSFTHHQNSPHAIIHCKILKFLKVIIFKN